MSDDRLMIERYADVDIFSTDKRFILTSSLIAMVCEIIIDFFSEAHIRIALTIPSVHAGGNQTAAFKLA